MIDPSRLSPKALASCRPTSSRLPLIERSLKPRPTSTSHRHPRDLQIDYTSPTFSIPQKVNFRYRLDHYDRDWHEAGTRRQAFYTDLPPGKYSFRVIACNSDGVWNDSAAQPGFLCRSGVLPDELVSRSLRVHLFGTAVGGVPVACPAIATSVRHDAGGACGRAHTDCTGTFTTPCFKAPTVCSSDSKLFPSYCRIARWKRKRSWTMRSSRRRSSSPKPGMRCRDCETPQYKPMISRWP